MIAFPTVARELSRVEVVVLIDSLLSLLLFTPLYYPPSPEFDTSTQDDGQPTTAETTDVIVIEDNLEQAEHVHYVDSYRLAGNGIYARPDEADNDDSPEGQIIRNEMAGYDRNIVETSDDDSDVVVHEIECEEDEEAGPTASEGSVG